MQQSTYDAAVAKNKELTTELDAAKKKQADAAQTLGGKIKELQGQLGQLGNVQGEKAASGNELAEYKNNRYLSTARANSVVQFMIKQSFAAAGYGEFDPVADNKTEPGKEQNRRIEIILVPELAELPSLTGNTP